MDVEALLRRMAELMGSLEDATAESEELDGLRDHVAALGPGVRADLERLLADPDETIAYQAARVLERMAEPGAFEAAVGYYLRHAGEVDGRAEPIWFDRLLALGPRALAVIEGRLAGETPLPERLAALELLAAVAGPAAVGRLTELTRDPDHRVAQSAAEALGRIGDPQAVATLLELLAHPDANVRYGALEGLDLVGDPAIVPRLVDVVAEDHAPVVAWWPSPAAGPITVAGRADALVTRLTGHRFDGDAEQLRAWVADHLPEH